MPLNLAKNMTRLYYTQKRPHSVKGWGGGIRNWDGNTLIMERVLYLGGAVVEAKGIIKHIVVKIDISCWN
ncbi:hypothetical protein [Spiroplasma endosymbiont of Polydrusus formosus]|uniref:hypothetical protein n=1 Tax=Spiroplasma endosymbiont of Polydrusus formosus TaxID=3139326 RepID=UPI0035B52BEA